MYFGKKKTTQAAKHSLHQLKGKETLPPSIKGKGDTLARSAVSLPHQSCHAQLLAVTIRVIWLVGFSVLEVTLPSLVQ